ncbi:MAG: PAS domain S-box protein, partial [Candidatus Jordarchaeaceae archaeon]
MAKEMEYKPKIEESASIAQSNYQADIVQKVFNITTAAVFILDSEVPPTIIECNESASRVFGYKKSEMLGKTMSFLYPNDESYREYLSLIYRDFEEGNKHQIALPECNMRRSDGSFFPAEHSVIRLLDEGEKQIGWAYIIKDITEKKKQEKSRRSIEESILQLAEKAKDIIYKISWEKGFEYINQASKAITGYTPEELYANPVLLYKSIHPEDLPKLHNFLNDLAAHRKPQSLEVRLFHKDGRLVVTEQINVPIYDETGKLIGIEGILRDITERKRIEADLLEEEEKFRSIFNESPIGIILYDSTTRVVDANKASLNILGVSSVEKLKGLKLVKDPNMSQEARKRILRGEPLIADIVYDFDKIRENKAYETSKSGIAHLHVVNTPIIRGKKITGYLVQVQDITESKRIEEMRRAHTSILEALVHSADMKTGLEKTVKIIRDYARCSSVGIRIFDEQGNIRYEAYTGFSDEFYKNESHLCIKDEKCMCFKISKGDCTEPFYTKNGSFYTNAMNKLQATIYEKEERKVSPICNRYGYESISVIPIRFGDQILGFIHLADERENMLPLETIQFIESVSSSIAVSVEKEIVTLQLREAEKKLERYANHLQELVEERTRELRETQEKLLKAERLAAIGELAAMVGHDLRNPLTGISGSTYILKRKLAQMKDEKMLELLDVIEKNVKYSNKIVTELLE